jgi:hypothetical protein
MGFHALGVIFGGTAVDGTWDGRCIAHSSGQEDTTAGKLDRRIIHALRGIGDAIRCLRLPSP